ncbi:EamA family transporter [Aquicoccus porphyridii]|uniref:EamA family transporter n=1 Tax=Aquicoccus porphyridii TaxID=1852029 RepID=A0A5A9ZCX1_9RHOB|nr:DMT family transporter [Aquicoccus porphyridii]KAA0914926.1 EamA family transporter [Aquicoccus porphyridii]RAI52529.1 EamA family transporter [Rhodobacteraceae bacterium AsT-22]
MNIPEKWAYPAVLIGVAGHASSEFFAKLGGVAGPETSVWRYLLGGFGLILWALMDRNSRDLITPLREEGVRLVGLSLMGVTVTYLFFHWALDYATVIQVATVTTTIPIFVGLANWVVNGVHPGAVKVVTGGLAVLGIAVLLTDGALMALAGEAGTLPGVLLAMGCAALGSFYAVLVKPVMVRHGGLKIIALTMMIGGIGLWLLVGAAWGVWVNPASIVEKPALAAWSLIVLALWNTTITQALWFGGLTAAPDITRASYLFFLKPIIAAALAIVILGSWPTGLQVVAIVLVTGCVLVELYWARIRAAFARG